MVSARRNRHVASVAQRSTSVSNLFIVRWGAPERGDCEQIQRKLAEVRVRSDKPLVYLSIMPADSPALDEAQRRVLAELTEAVLPHCAHLSMVVEARGVRGAILRSAMTAVILLSRRHDTLAVVDSIEAALERTRGKLPPLPMVRQALREVGCEITDLRVAVA
jgi:hypothetical protein